MSFVDLAIFVLIAVLIMWLLYHNYRMRSESYHLGNATKAWERASEQIVAQLETLKAEDHKLSVRLEKFSDECHLRFAGAKELEEAVKYLEETADKAKHVADELASLKYDTKISRATIRKNVRRALSKLDLKYEK